MDTDRYTIAAIDAIDKSGRPIDVLINNAGVLHEKPLLQLTNAQIADSIAFHITGPLRSSTPSCRTGVSPPATTRIPAR